MINRLNIKLCFFLLFVMFLLGGCSESSGAEKELEVLIEPQFRDQVKEAAKYMKEQTPQVSITIWELPADGDDGEERELEIERLRTQIMAGKGPDVYLINSASDGATQMEAPLFSNPYKTMQSGALASLDRYMESDSYWDDSCPENIRDSNISYPCPAILTSWLPIRKKSRLQRPIRWKTGLQRQKERRIPDLKRQCTDWRISAATGSSLRQIMMKEKCCSTRKHGRLLA